MLCIVIYVHLSEHQQGTYFTISKQQQKSQKIMQKVFLGICLSYSLFLHSNNLSTSCPYALFLNFPQPFHRASLRSTCLSSLKAHFRSAVRSQNHRIPSPTPFSLQDYVKLNHMMKSVIQMLLEL